MAAALIMAEGGRGAKLASTVRFPVIVIVVVPESGLTGAAPVQSLKEQPVAGVAVIGAELPMSNVPPPVAVPPEPEVTVRTNCCTNEGEIVAFASRTIAVEALVGETMLPEPDQPFVR